jgi:hypothetical protein
VLNILDKLQEIRVSGASMQVLAVILVHSRCRGSRKAEISQKQFKEATKISSSHVVRALDMLVIMRVITVTQDLKDVNKIYRVNGVSEWRQLPPEAKKQKPLHEKAVLSAEYMARKISEMDKNYKSLEGDERQKTVIKWARHIEMIHRVDKRSWDDIKTVLSWVYRPSSFWKTNILSGKKLREKFPTLYLQSFQNFQGQPEDPGERHGFMPDNKRIEMEGKVLG